MPTATARTATARTIEQSMAKRLGASRFERYFADGARFDFSGTTLRIRVKDRFYGEWLESKFGNDLRDAMNESVSDESASIDWVVDPASFGAATETNAPANDGAHEREAGNPEPALTAAPAVMRGGGAVAVTGRGKRPLWKNPPLQGRLDDFIVGACNRLAYKAAMRIAHRDQSVDFSMLFLHGECGNGKSHLLQGIVNEYKKARPGTRARYVTGEAFTNRYISAVRKGRMSQFRDAFRDLELLCIDDLHFISGKDGTQSEILHTLKDLDLQGARIVLASDEHPRRIAKLDHRLISRLLSGMIVAVDRPDAETRQAMVKRIVSSRGLSLEPAALGALAERCEGSVRDIVGAVTRIEALLKLTPEACGPSGVVSVALVHRALGEVNMSRPTRAIKVAEIATTVCAELMVDLSEMLGKSRHKRVVLARSLTAHLSRRLTTHSYPEIACQMNRNNHSTIVTACQRIERSMEAADRVEDPLTGESAPLVELVERLRAAVLRDTARVSSA